MCKSVRRCTHCSAPCLKVGRHLQRQTCIEFQAHRRFPKQCGIGGGCRQAGACHAGMALVRRMQVRLGLDGHRFGKNQASRNHLGLVGISGHDVGIGQRLRHLGLSWQAQRQPSVADSAGQRNTFAEHLSGRVEAGRCWLSSQPGRHYLPINLVMCCHARSSRPERSTSAWATRGASPTSLPLEVAITLPTTVPLATGASRPGLTSTVVCTC